MYNRYLEHLNKQKQHIHMECDDRNPYGSRSGYVGDKRNSRMVYDGNGRECDYRYDYRYDADYRYSNNDVYNQQHGQHQRGKYYEDYGSEEYYTEKRYKDDLMGWIKKLKAQDTRLNTSREQVLRQARNMGIDFRGYDEDELYATYLMQVSDYPDATNDYNIYIKMAKQWLEDKDVALKGSEKLCAYYYTIVMGEE